MRGAFCIANKAKGMPSKRPRSATFPPCPHLSYRMNTESVAGDVPRGYCTEHAVMVHAVTPWRKSRGGSGSHPMRGQGMYFHVNTDVVIAARELVDWI